MFPLLLAFGQAVVVLEDAVLSCGLCLSQNDCGELAGTRGSGELSSELWRYWDVFCPSNGAAWESFHRSPVLCLLSALPLERDNGESAFICFCANEVKQASRNLHWGSVLGV